MVPKFFCSSSLVMPTPESIMTSFFWSLTGRMVMFKSGAASNTVESVKASKRVFSMASPLFEQSSYSRQRLRNAHDACCEANEHVERRRGDDINEKQRPGRACRHDKRDQAEATWPHSHQAADITLKWQRFCIWLSVRKGTQARDNQREGAHLEVATDGRRCASSNVSTDRVCA